MFGTFILSHWCVISLAPSVKESSPKEMILNSLIEIMVERLGFLDRVCALADQACHSKLGIMLTTLHTFWMLFSKARAVGCISE